MSRQTRYALNVMPFALAVFLLLFVPRFEAWVFPVVKDFVVTGMVKEPGHVVLSGYMRKNRDCQFRAVNAEALMGDHWADVPLRFLDSENHTATRPTGTQSWGPWQVTVPVSWATRDIRLTAVHSCHPVWPTESVLAVIPIKVPE